MSSIKNFWQTTAAVFAALLLGSCAEDVDVPGQQKGTQMNISVSIHQDWDDDEATRASRMEGSDYAGPPEAVRFDGTIGGKPVYIWCDELDGIDEGLSPLTAEAPEVSGPADTDAATRGTLMTATGTGAATDDMSMFHKTFSIWPYGNDGTIPKNTKAERPWNANLWRVENAFTFPTTNNYYVLGLAPYDGGYTQSSSWWIFNYVTPEKAIDQSDLMGGWASARQADEEILFNFTHYLSAIRFKMGASGFPGGYTIKRIQLSGIYTQAQFETSPSAKWYNYAGADKAVYQDFNFPITDATYNTMITNDGTATTTGTTFLLIPQSKAFTCNITLEDAGGRQSTITASIPAKQWRAGYTYTYTIASEVDNSDFTLTVNGNPVFSYTGAYVSGGASSSTNQYGVISYRKTSKNVSKPVAWEIVKYEYSDDDGATWTDNGAAKPAWLTALSLESGDGGTSAQYGNATLNSADYIEDKNAERNAKFKTTPVSDYDLSTHDIKGNATAMNTANCYVISAPGTYKLPLVYGNAIKNGATNASAYTSTVESNCLWGSTFFQQTVYWWKDSVYVNQTPDYSGTYAIRRSYGKMHRNPFVDYKGGDIRDPWIKVNKANDDDPSKGIPTRAAVLWTDGSSEIVTNPAINGDYLTFEVPAANLRQGNAEIVVYDETSYNSGAMWGWHLWFAPDDVLDVTEHTNAAGIAYQVPKETLGFTVESWQQSTYTAPRKVRVTVQQKESISGGTPQTGQFVITQNPGMDQSAYTTYYQFGRQDPIPFSRTGDEIYVTTGGMHPYQAIRRTLPVFYCQPRIPFATNAQYAVAAAPNSQYYVCPEDDNLQGWMYFNRTSYTITNLWAANADVDNPVTLQSNPSVKTVYDPCPVGFHVPERDAFDNQPTFPYTSFPSAGYISGALASPTLDAPYTVRLPSGATGGRGGTEYDFLLNWISDYPFGTYSEAGSNGTTLYHQTFVFGAGRCARARNNSDGTTTLVSSNALRVTYSAYMLHPIADQ